jgi:hypothetical protein
MGGSRETTISGLRLHINDADQEVHIHDDKAGVKFQMSTSEFKREMKEAFDVLKNGSGLYPIKGSTRTSLFIINHDGCYSVALSESSIKSKVEDFLGTC